MTDELIEKIGTIFANRVQEMTGHAFNWKDFIEEAQAAIDAMQGWRPIESAPRNQWCLIDVSGEVVRAIKRGSLIELEYWFPHLGVDEIPRYTWANDMVTGWMPLPQPPKKG